MEGGLMIPPLQSDDIALLDAQIAKAQAEIKMPVKDAINPHFKNRYADLEAVMKSVLPALSKHGVAITQMQVPMLGSQYLVTQLSHKGQWIRSYAELTPTQKTEQAKGSSLTYNRRYSASAICGIASEPDDDGNAATAGGNNASTNPAVPKFTPSQKGTSPVPSSTTRSPADIFKSMKDKE